MPLRKAVQSPQVRSRSCTPQESLACRPFDVTAGFSDCAINPQIPLSDSENSDTSSIAPIAPSAGFDHYAEALQENTSKAYAVLQKIYEAMTLLHSLREYDFYTTLMAVRGDIKAAFGIVEPQFFKPLNEEDTGALIEASIRARVEHYKA